MESNIVALYDIGCVVGAITTYIVGERLGRRTMLILGGSIMILGTAILASSFSIEQLIVGRIVTGIGNGMNSSTAPVYQSECSPSSFRGALLSSQGTVTILGVVIAYWLGYGTSFTDLPAQWRFPLAFQAFFATCPVLQVIGLPETPRWLVAHDRDEEARQVISDLTDLPLHDVQVHRVILDIRSGVEEEQKGGPFKIEELFYMGKSQNFRRLLLTISIEFIQQFSGSNMINYYGPVMYQENMGLSRNLSLILGGCTQIAYLFGSAIPLFVMDRYGRRNLLMFSVGGLFLCMLMVSILLGAGNGAKGPAYGATAFIFLYQIFYGVGLLPVPWFYPSEINTTRVRARLSSIASAWNWMFVFTIVKITPISFANIGWRTFIIYTVLNFAFVPFMYCFYPETKGLELEDISLLSEKGGLTGGVFHAKGGRTVEPHQHALNLNLDSKLEKEEVEQKVE
jgi:sugar porter (SP) family MFS transporter